MKVDVVASEGEVRVLANMRSKAEKAARMFDAIIQEMNNAENRSQINKFTQEMEVPSWL